MAIIIIAGIGLAGTLEYKFGLTPKQKCELGGGVWNFTFPAQGSNEPTHICDREGTIRFGRMGETYYGSDGSSYGKAAAKRPVSKACENAVFSEKCGGGGMAFYKNK